MTAAADHSSAKPEKADDPSAICIRHVLKRVSSIWAMLVVSALGGGVKDAEGRRLMRYSELAKSVEGVSSKMLSQTLQSLERDGLVTRTATATVPVTVTYELTELGLSLHEVVRSFTTWTDGHIDEIAAHQERFDGAEPLERS